MRIECWMSCAVLAASCTVSDGGSEKVAIDERNDLGIVSLQVDQFVDHGDKIFELRGLNATGDERALVRSRTGEVDELRDLPGGDPFGTEISVAVEDKTMRLATRETQDIRVSPNDDVEIVQFLALSSVQAALESARITVVMPDAATSGEVPTSYGSCASSYMLNSPVALQCCGSSLSTSSWTLHANASNQTVTRYYNTATGSGCRSNTGATCSGASCYYGPAGYARPILASGSGSTPYPRVEVTQQFIPYPYPGYYVYFCNPNWYSSPQTPVFGNVTGTFPRNAGCCVNGSGICDKTGYPACTSCGGGGSSGAGQWDY